MWRASLLALLLSASLSAQTLTPSPSIEVKDEGTRQGFTRSINCVGAGISCTATTITASGGAGSFSATEFELDFDTCGIGSANAPEMCQVAVTDATVSATSKLVISQAGIAATSRDADENEMDFLICHALPASGTFTLTCLSMQGPTHGKFKVWYAVG